MTHSKWFIPNLYDEAGNHQRFTDPRLEAMRHRCANCGKYGAVHQISYRDVCPTDRGVEVREGTEYLCDECAEEQ